MDVAYFPGCSLHSMAREYDISTRAVCKYLGVNLHEIKDWNCCGATAAHSLDHFLAIGLGGRNLKQIGEMNLDMASSPCAACYSRLKSAAIELRQNVDIREELERLLEVKIPVEIEITNLLELMVTRVGLENIARRVQKPLRGLRLAAYYGCLLTRSVAVSEFDDPEQPMSMDRLLRVLGAETVTWSHKAECCGGGFATCGTDIVIDLGGQVLQSAREAGAEAVVVACPMCQINLDTRQRAIDACHGVRYDLPVIYFTQLMGLAFGYPARKMGLQRLLVSPVSLLRAKGLV